MLTMKLTYQTKNLKNEYANNVYLSDCIQNFKLDNVTIWIELLTFLDNFPTHGDIWSTIYQSMWVVVKVIRAILLEVGITLVTLDGISWNEKIWEQLSPIHQDIHSMVYL